MRVIIKGGEGFRRGGGKMDFFFYVFHLTLQETTTARLCRRRLNSKYNGYARAALGNFPPTGVYDYYYNYIISFRLQHDRCVYIYMYTYE